MAKTPAANRIAERKLRDKQARRAHLGDEEGEAVEGEGHQSGHARLNSYKGQDRASHASASQQSRK